MFFFFTESSTDVETLQQLQRAAEFLSTPKKVPQTIILLSGENLQKLTESKKSAFVNSCSFSLSNKSDRFS